MPGLSKGGCLSLLPGTGTSPSVDCFALRSNNRCFFLLVDPSKTACEFAQRRLDNKVYTEWHQGRLMLEQHTLKARTHTDLNLHFDASPLVLCKGRLHIPQTLLEDFLEDEGTAEAAAKLVADHAKEFLSEGSDYTMARLELAKQGMVGKAGLGPSRVVLQQVQQLPGDPKDPLTLKCAMMPWLQHGGNCD